MKYKEVAEVVGYNHIIVTRALAHWYESRNLPAPDGRKFVGRLPRKPKVEERIAEDVLEHATLCQRARSICVLRRVTDKFLDKVRFSWIDESAKRWVFSSRINGLWVGAARLSG